MKCPLLAASQLSCALERFPVLGIDCLIDISRVHDSKATSAKSTTMRHVHMESSSKPDPPALSSTARASASDSLPTYIPFQLSFPFPQFQSCLSILRSLSLAFLSLHLSLLLLFLWCSTHCRLCPSTASFPLYFHCTSMFCASGCRRSGYGTQASHTVSRPVQLEL